MLLLIHHTVNIRQEHCIVGNCTPPRVLEQFSSCPLGILSILWKCTYCTQYIAFCKYSWSNMCYAIANIPRERTKTKTTRKGVGNVVEKAEKAETYKRLGRKGKQCETYKSEKSECVAQGQSVVLLWICLPGHNLPGGQRGGHRISRQCWQGVDNKHAVRTGHLQDRKPQERLKILCGCCLGCPGLVSLATLWMSVCVCVCSLRDILVSALRSLPYIRWLECGSIRIPTPSRGQRWSPLNWWQTGETERNQCVWQSWGIRKETHLLFKCVEAAGGRWLALGGQRNKEKCCLPVSSLRLSTLQTIEEDWEEDRQTLSFRSFSGIYIWTDWW